MSVIPKEKLGGFQRWQINSFDQKPVAPTANVTPPPVEAEEITVSNEIVDTPIELPTAEDIERIHEEARQDGYKAGFQEGREAALKEIETLRDASVEKSAALIASMEQALLQLDRTVARQVLDLSLEVARQMTRGAIKAEPEFLLPIIREALSYLPLHHAHITLHIHPDDAATLGNNLAERLGQNTLQIVESGDIGIGGCRITAGASEVDATVETRWQRVLESIGTEPQAWLSPK